MGRPQHDPAARKDNDMKHDARYPISASTYTNHSCRCTGCKNAQLEYNRRYWATHPEKYLARLERVREKRRWGEWL
jgi:hypothetical protein